MILSASILICNTFANKKLLVILSLRLEVQVRDDFAAFNGPGLSQALC